MHGYSNIKVIAFTDGWLKPMDTEKNGDKLQILSNIQTAKATHVRDTLGVRAQESAEHSVIEG
jgi:hypothetical protein